MRKHIIHISLAFFCFLSLWWAYGHYSQKIEAHGEESWATYQEKMELEAKNKEKLLKQAAKTKNQTLADRVSYLTLKKGEVKISIIASSMSVTEEKRNIHSVWGKLLENSFNELDHMKVDVTANGNCGSSGTEMIDKERLEELISSQPDIVFFELCLPSEGEARGSLEAFQERVEWAMEEQKKGLPETLVIVQTSNPFTNYEVVKPATGFGYAEFNAEMQKFIEENGWNFIDTYTLMTEKMAEREIAFKELLAEPAGPGSLSQKIWTEVINENVHIELVDP